jgi:hypothetical protein
MFLSETPLLHHLLLPNLAHIYVKVAMIVLINPN